MALQRRPAEVRRHEPRLLAHPFELAVGLMFMIAAAANVQMLLTYPAGAPRTGLLSLPVPVLCCWIVFMGIGGVLIAAGLLLGTTRAWPRAIEKAGLWLSLSVWSTLAVAMLFIDRSQWSTTGQALAMVLGCLLRMKALSRVERAVDKALEQEATRAAVETGMGSEA